MCRIADGLSHSGADAEDLACWLLDLAQFFYALACRSGLPTWCATTSRWLWRTTTSGFCSNRWAWTHGQLGHMSRGEGSRGACTGAHTSGKYRIEWGPAGAAEAAWVMVRHAGLLGAAKLGWSCRCRSLRVLVPWLSGPSFLTPSATRQRMRPCLLGSLRTHARLALLFSEGYVCLPNTHHNMCSQAQAQQRFGGSCCPGK